MIEFISQSWAWYVAGPMIAFVMLLLLWAGGEFGVSSSLRVLCSMGGAGKKVAFFNFDWKSQLWNIAFIIGAVIGGFVAANILQSPDAHQLSSATIADLAALNIPFDGGLAPTSIFNWQALQSPQAWLILVGGGFLIGFGTRWAGGCTSGHAISGLANFQLPSLIAVIGFFIGGLLMTHLFFPLIF